jgi:hypothetical protein
MWLDLARYADTQGYEKDQARTIWRYRDWVIDAFNRDLPYDQFTIEQLAGDLLPNPTPSQILATAFHRNTMTNTEGGTDPEEFRTTAVKDRIDTTVQVWMGLTFGCAKCHTHKYDPITNQEYYRFYALFNQTEDANRGDEFPTVPTPTEEQQHRQAALDEKLKGLREAFRQPRPELEAQQRSWEKELAANGLWTAPPFESATAAGGATLRQREDGAIVVSGPHPERDTYTVTVPLTAGPARSLRLEALKDPSLPNGGPGRDASDQNVVTSELSVELIDPQGSERTPLPLSAARADHEQGGFPIAHAVDGNPETGWAWAPQNGQPHVAVFDFKSPVGAAGWKLRVTIRQNYRSLHHGCFRLSVSNGDPALLKAELRPVSELATLPREQRSVADQQRLDDAFRQTQEPTATLYRQIAAAEQERAAIDRAIPKTPVMRDLPKERHRVTKIHQRGNFLDPGEVVTPAFPAAFGAFPEGAPLNRLGAAKWLVSRDNPLTARVAVNRVWARLFGNGLVETEEDFGTQGTPPTHPLLLDWLAAVFASAPASHESDGGTAGRRDSGAPRTGEATATGYECGWSFKQLLKLIVTSAAYRRSSSLQLASGREPSPPKVGGPGGPGPQSMDPENRWLWRGPRFRMPAEVMRDQALAVSGLLSAKMYGPSVMPPQPDGLWKTVYSGLKWQTSPGEDRYRRALYTYWRRTSPYPSLTTFDAGSGEFCVIRRVRTNTPLQALVTLNDPAFVEAAGALAKRMLETPDGTLRDRLALGFRRVLVRPATGTELDRLKTLPNRPPAWRSRTCSSTSTKR